MPIKQAPLELSSGNYPPLSGLWARPVGCWCLFIISHISLCFTVCFTFLFIALVATQLCHCCLRRDYMWAVMPWWLAPCDLGYPGGGISGFRMVLCCFAQLEVWPCVFFVLPFVSAAAPCQDNTMLWQDNKNVITRALIRPWTGTCHAFVWLFCFGLLCFALFWWFAFGFCFRIVVTWWRPTGLWAGPIPVHSWGPSICRRPRIV